MAVDTGCNTGRGTYTVAGDAVTFGPIATTRMACVDPNGQQVEQAVLTVLTGTATVAIDGPVLTLMNGANGLQLRATTGHRHGHHDGRHDDDVGPLTRGGKPPPSR